MVILHWRLAELHHCSLGRVSDWQVALMAACPLHLAQTWTTGLNCARARGQEPLGQRPGARGCPGLGRRRPTAAHPERANPRPGNGLGLPAAPAPSAQSTAHGGDLAQLTKGQ